MISGYAQAGVSRLGSRSRRAWYVLRRRDHLCPAGSRSRSTRSSADSASLAEGVAQAAPSSGAARSHRASRWQPAPRHIGSEVRPPGRTAALAHPIRAHPPQMPHVGNRYALIRSRNRSSRSVAAYRGSSQLVLNNAGRIASSRCDHFASSIRATSVTQAAPAPGCRSWSPRPRPAIGPAPRRIPWGTSVGGSPTGTPHRRRRRPLTRRSARSNARIVRGGGSQNG